MQELALSVEVCIKVSDALDRVNHSKLEVSVIDFSLGNQATLVLQQLRNSLSNRTAVTFAITATNSKTAHALKAGSSFAPPETSDLRIHSQHAHRCVRIDRAGTPPLLPLLDFRSGSRRRRGESEMFGKTVNVSERGMAFIGSTPLMPGAEATMQFVVTDPRIAMTVECKVCWTNDKGSPACHFYSCIPTLAPNGRHGWGGKLEEQLPGPVSRRFQ
ncbi:MAG TPA: PilZ domain-containing protein [Terriglobales bacterium]|jgi:hypothetical protein|nr:PilZ domain-containing protein [Terriglobales bacterium]